MRELDKEIFARICTADELVDEQAELLISAIKVREKAQAPYSNYKVGAAVRTFKGRVFTGCNIECCTLTQTTHAEQAAIAKMVSKRGPVKIRSIAIAGAPSSVKKKDLLELIFKTSDIMSLDQIPAPCGHCRQIIWENCFNDHYVNVIILLPGGGVALTNIGSIFPMRFGPSDLGVDFSKCR